MGEQASIQRKLENLAKEENGLIPEAKTWNQNRLFLTWGFTSAIIITSGFKLFDIIMERYSPSIVKNIFDFWKLFKIDYQFWGYIIFFILGWFVTLYLSKKIDKMANEKNNRLIQIKRERDCLINLR